MSEAGPDPLRIGSGTHKIRRLIFSLAWHVRDPQDRSIAEISRPTIVLALWMLCFVASYIFLVFLTALVPKEAPHWVGLSAFFSAFLGPLVIFYVFTPPSMTKILDGAGTLICETRPQAWSRWSKKHFSIRDHQGAFLGQISIREWKAWDAQGHLLIHTSISPDASNRAAWGIFWLSGLSGGRAFSPDAAGSYNADFCSPHSKTGDLASLIRTNARNYELRVKDAAALDPRILLALSALRIVYGN